MSARNEAKKKLNVRFIKIEAEIQEQLTKSISSDFENRLRILQQEKNDNEEKLKEARKKELEFFKDINNVAMFRGGAAFADAVTFGAEKVDKKLVEEFSKIKGKKTLPYNAESDLTDYLQLYNDLSK